ncbi:hypothetical protein KIN20_032855 [Parelaphostrongylus tenuis]|uniref:Uncharacterized protein n=1 Tax=Parelaphostrongylus tenuis TaxID=148309 RepID=A0AAD5R9F6_PARTN|nr:hypothetical protein KIN20_032855 [Parelaphostrongylus tenuis]
MVPISVVFWQSVRISNVKMVLLALKASEDPQFFLLQADCKRQVTPNSSISEKSFSVRRDWWCLSL